MFISKIELFFCNNVEKDENNFLNKTISLIIYYLTYNT